MKRVMCVYLPRWPLQRLWSEHTALRDKPLALAVPGTRGAQVAWCCTRAERAGVRPGVPVAEALTMERHLDIRDIDAEGDMQSLERLAEWMDRFSPIVGLEIEASPQGLLIDITGCTPFFRGEDKLLEKTVRGLTDQGFASRVAVADTVGAAWGLAHFAHTPCRIPPEKTEQALQGLPTAALRLPAEAVDVLAGLGITQVHQLMTLPRSDLPARFGAMLLLRLDQALGRVPEVIKPHRPIPETMEVYAFEYATERMAALNLAIDQLTQRISSTLQSRNRGARRVECWLYHETAEPKRIETSFFRPCRSAEHLQMLLRVQLERIQLAEPVTSVCLRITETEPLSDAQAEFFESEPQKQEKALADLIDRLSVRLGRRAVTRPVLVPDPQPEFAYRLEPLIRTRNQQQRSSLWNSKRSENIKPAWVPNRPLQLWSYPLEVEVMSVVPEGPPIRLRWAGQDYRLVHAWGPERIETGWWRGDDVHRDYYVAVTHTGLRFWLFRRQEDGRWFMHGCFD